MTQTKQAKYELLKEILVCKDNLLDYIDSVTQEVEKERYEWAQDYCIDMEREVNLLIDKLELMQKKEVVQ